MNREKTPCVFNIFKWVTFRVVSALNKLPCCWMSLPKSHFVPLLSLHNTWFPDIIHIQTHSQARLVPVQLEFQPWKDKGGQKSGRWGGSNFTPTWIPLPEICWTGKKLADEIFPVGADRWAQITWLARKKIPTKERAALGGERLLLCKLHAWASKGHLDLGGIPTSQTSFSCMLCFRTICRLCLLLLL